MAESNERARRIVDAVLREKAPVEVAPKRPSFLDDVIEPVREIFAGTAQGLSDSKSTARIDINLNTHQPDRTYMIDDRYTLFNNAGDMVFVETRVMLGTGAVPLVSVHGADKAFAEAIKPLQNSVGWIEGYIQPSLLDEIERYLVRYLAETEPSANA